MHACIHTYIHTYVRSYVRTYIHTYVRSYVRNTYIHSYIYTCIHASIHIYIHTYSPSKMADDVNAAIGAALNTISSTAQSSSNMKNELKHTIFENVSTLGKLFVQLIELSERSNKKISEMEKLANHTMVEQRGAANSRSKRAQGAPSIISRQELAKIGDRQVAPTRMGQTKLYSEVLGGKTKQSRHTLTVTSKEGQPPDAIKIY